MDIFGNEATILNFTVSKRGGDERTSHDALLPTILSKFLAHVIFHFDMDAIRMTSRCDRPFVLSKLIYIHCIDLGTKKYTTVTSFPCLELCCVLGHFSFPRELAVRRLCVFYGTTIAKVNS